VKHAHIAIPPFLGHRTALNAWSYVLISLAAIGLLGVYEYSPGLFAVLAVFGGLVLALRQRIERLKGGTTHAAHSPRGFVRADGGSFPGDKPSAKGAPVAHVVVVDGGSLEHHHS
jgi:hypothetical protein